MSRCSNRDLGSVCTSGASGVQLAYLAVYIGGKPAGDNVQVMQWGLLLLGLVDLDITKCFFVKMQDGQKR